MTPSTLLHPLKLDVVGFQEDEHDYHFRVELPEPKCCESCGTIHNLVKYRTAGVCEAFHSSSLVTVAGITTPAPLGRCRYGTCHPPGRLRLRNQNLRHEPLVAIMPRWRRLFAVWPIDYLQPEFLPGQRARQAVIPADQNRRMRRLPLREADYFG